MWNAPGIVSECIPKYFGMHSRILGMLGISRNWSRNMPEFLRIFRMILAIIPGKFLIFFPEYPEFFRIFGILVESGFGGKGAGN